MTERVNLIDIKKNPLILFSEWFEEAKQKEINDPNAMNLSTISKSLMPSSRIVLLKYFDKNGWLYFTKQTFDLLYPSCGDSYPMFLGSIGMTYEQAGGGRAGLGIINDNYQLLTLKERIEHHFTTSISTIEFSIKNKSVLNENFQKFFFDKKRKYKFYILEGNSDILNSLKNLLSKHGVKIE